MAVYILSTGRTGTSSIAGICERLFPDHRVCHERSGTRILNIVANMNSLGFAPRGLVQFLWNRAFNDERPFVEVNNFLWLASGLVGKPGVDDLVVHVVRDPRDYVESHINISRQRPKSYIANQWVPFWQPRFKSRQLEKNVHDAVAQFANIWVQKNTYMSRYDKKNYLLIRFEDLFSNAHETVFNGWEPLISKIEQVLGTSAHMESFNILKRNESALSNGQGWRQWEGAQARYVDKVCGNLARSYGYFDEPEWVELIQEVDP